MSGVLEDGLIKTGVIEQVVAPLSTHLCHLILLCGSETDLEKFTQLETSAKSVAKSSKNMASVASRIVADSEDDILKMEMCPLVECLTVSGQHVLLAAQKLSIQPDVVEHREELIEATQNVLLGVVKILLVEDNATIRKITASADWLLECISQVEAAADMLSLLKAFQVYSKAMLLLHRLVVERIQELRDRKQQSSLKASLETLKKCVSMLHTAMYTTIKHPNSQEAHGAKRYILKQVNQTINEIKTTLTSNCEPGSSGTCGHYTETKKQVEQLLSTPASVRDGALDVILRDLVFHSMIVANTSRRESQFEVATDSKLVLQLWSDLSQRLVCGKDHHGSDQHLANTCASLLRQIHKLNDVVTKATLFLLMEVFITNSASQVEHTLSLLSPEEHGTIGLDIKALLVQVKDFLAHANKTSEVAGFISALACDQKSLDCIENSRVCVVRLKQAIAALLPELEKDGEQCSAPLQQLKEMCERWREEMEQLLYACSSVINVKDFVSLTLQEMESNWMGCVEAHRENDSQFLRRQTCLLLRHMSLVIQFVKKHVSKSDNPIYRNGLLVLVKQAEASAAELTTCVSDIYSTTSLSKEAFSMLSDNLATAMDHFDILRKGLDGLEHPHLLSPLREGARQAAIPVSVLTISSPGDKTGSEVSVASSIGDEEQYILTEDLEIPMVPQLWGLQVSKTEERWTAPVVETKPVEDPHNVDLLPVLIEVLGMTKGRDVEALNLACSGLLGLSNSYVQATREVASIIDTSGNNEVEILRSKLVSLTPLLVQTAQETAMSSGMSTDSIYKHGTQFSEVINDARKILLPLCGKWYHAVSAMFLNCLPGMVESVGQDLTESMCLCADAVRFLSSVEINVIGECHESITSLQSKLQKAQNNTKSLMDLVSARPTQRDELDSLCILWALSVQVVLNSLDKILGTTTTDAKGQRITPQLTPKKWLTVISENSLRIQEAARLCSLNCRDSYKVKLMNDLKEEVKTLTDLYLQAAEDASSTSISSVLMLAKSEFLQRQLQAKMKALSHFLRKINQDYVTAIQSTLTLAWSAKLKANNTQDYLAQFESAAECLMQNVKTATDSIQNCLGFVRDPKERSKLRFINDHLMFHMSEIMSRARLIAETQTLGDSLSLDIQSQCWAAKAHYLVEELDKVEGVLQVTKKKIKLGLQGKESWDVVGPQTTKTLPTKSMKEVPQPSPNECSSVVSQLVFNVQDVPDQKPRKEMTSQWSTRSSVYTLVDTTQSYTSLFLKRETEKWDDQGNQIVQVTKEMADKLYQMSQYLKKKGPIQSKDAFVTSAKDLISNGQSITQFVRVIADHCLDKHCTEELCVIAEQILTISNQLTIISSVNAVTPGCKSSDEILVKNAQNLLQTVIQGVRAAETACIRGLKQPEPNSEAAKAAAFCFQWKESLLIHRAQEQLNPDTDDLGLRKTSKHPGTPSLAPPINVLEGYK